MFLTDLIPEPLLSSDSECAVEPDDDRNLLPTEGSTTSANVALS
jgi:hypothetical protein